MKSGNSAVICVIESFCKEYCFSLGWSLRLAILMEQIFVLPQLELAHQAEVYNWFEKGFGGQELGTLDQIRTTE